MWAQPWHGHRAPNCAGPMASPVDASPAGNLVGKGWAGRGCGEGMMGKVEEGWGVGASGSVGFDAAVEALARRPDLTPILACRPCQWVGSPPEKEDYLQQRAAA